MPGGNAVVLKQAASPEIPREEPKVQPGIRPRTAGQQPQLVFELAPGVQQVCPAATGP